MVAACPSAVAAVLSLETCLISFNNTSGSLPDLIGFELYLHSGIGRPPLVQTYCHRVDAVLTEARPGRRADGARVAGTSLGLRPRGGTWRGSSGCGRRDSGHSDSKRPGCGAPRPGGGHSDMCRSSPGVHPEAPGAAAVGPRGRGWDKPARPPVAGALGTGKRARPRRFQFSPRLLVTV